MTPRQLAIEMNQRGYSVSLRRLRDWRAKGLLPPLMSRGRGRGKGRWSSWEEPGIVDQAIAVRALTARRARFAGQHYLERWLLGYSADPCLVRKAWLASLDRVTRDWTHDALNSDGVEDALAPVADRVARTTSSETGLQYDDLQGLVLELLTAVFVLPSSQPFDPATLAGLADAANAWLAHSGAAHGKDLPRITEVGLQEFLKFVRDDVSIESVRRAVAGASDMELMNAHRRWREIRRFCGLFVLPTCQEEGFDELRQQGERLSVLFGGHCLLALLWAARHGMGSWVDAKLAEFGASVSASLRARTSCAR